MCRYLKTIIFIGLDNWEKADDVHLESGDPRANAVPRYLGT